MTDITNNPSQSVSIQERVRLAQEAKAELDKQIAENNRLLEELEIAQDAILNNPVERAKLFVDANKMIEEVRRQFKEIPGILEGTGKPDYAKCVSISTSAALNL